MRVSSSCLALMLAFAAAPAICADGRPNIAVVMVDTLRADLGDAKAPHIRRLCEKGREFPNANSTTPSTRSSIASLFTGVGPDVHGVRHGKTHLNDFRGKRLAELLRKRGYNTYAFVTNPNIDSVFGHARGFDEYHELYRRTERQLKPASSDELVTNAGALAEALEAATLEEPYFAFVLAIDPHRPYTPPDSADCRNPESWSRDCYRAEVEYFDAQLPRILAVFDSATVFFTSDHGEEFGEHGQFGHGKNVFETSTHVPLCIAGAGQGEQVERVDTLDIAATILSLAGIDVPRNWLGRDLLAATIERRYVISIWEPQKAHRWGEEKRLETKGTTLWFDLAADPGEEDPEIREGAEADEETLEVLKSLGYVR